ncbi:hypothetical protein B0H16DRAFT_1601602 [Mycena metata]|uniref:Uncharacterized protein n=1 Tax=Mycena metata TaxID=1033252 RepID=A0AAD7HKF6_9AGAR|nr:hypothetical protein B0H16DRAFT_1601602 [Mycena metata]
MKGTLLTGIFVFLATAAASGTHHSTETDEDCVVDARVRAEDLAPDHVSHGELRIKVKEALCADRIASVALRLQLEEFSEIKKSPKQNAPGDFSEPLGASANDTIYDYGPYDRALSDAALWEVKAEERIAWSTEAVLFDNNPDFSQAMITPFTIVTPPVNYPPSVYNRRAAIVTALPVRRHAYSVVGYRYTAVVNFTDGRSLDVPVGHTNFAPTSPPPPPKTPFSWNVTFTNNFGCEELPTTRLDNVRSCLPEELRSVFRAEVTLPDGNVIKRGQPLKGRVTVHSTEGSTAMSDIGIAFATANDNLWAKRQAETGGDENYSKLLCEESTTREVISPDAFPAVFQMDTDLHDSFTHGRLSADKPYVDFELEIKPSVAPDFTSYYTAGEASLRLSLGVLYSADTSVCIEGEKYSTMRAAKKAELAAANTARTMETLWDAHTPVGSHIEDDPSPIDYHRRLELVATVPLVVLGDISARPMAHYLQPGLPVPIILPAHKASGSYQPKFIEEPLEDTSARLMRSEGTHDPTPPPTRSSFGIGRILPMRFPRGTPDPAAHYRTGLYAGLLWKKKLVAMERGLLPVQAAEKVAHVPDHGQQGFVVPS